METGRNGAGTMNILFSNKFDIQSYGLTDSGCVRDHNEDAFLDAGKEGFWVIADGAGGHEGGEVASKLIVDKLASIKRNRFFGRFVDKIKNGLQQANAELIKLSGGEETSRLIASTVCVLIIQKNRAVSLWSGDSRIYLQRNKRLSQITRDHNRIDEFLKAGFSQEEAEKSPLAQHLTTAVGVASPLFTETQNCEVKKGDIFLMCSDGLFKEVTDLEIESILQQKSPKEMATSLMDKALSRKASDNVTVLIVTVA